MFAITKQNLKTIEHSYCPPLQRQPMSPKDLWFMPPSAFHD